MPKIKKICKHKDDEHEYIVRVVMSADVTINGEKMRSSARMQDLLKEEVEAAIKRVSYWFNPNE